ncbi:MAG: patatin-like phospholipase family protein [Nevskia sp.]|nr:patatin-like phospholipase family protein [Nevskia sp.]
MSQEQERHLTPSESPTVSTARRPIFAIFEGGGAKGIAHVGAYAAADSMQLEFVGVAGASAGSIVASLIAVGFRPAEIFDPQCRSGDILSTNQLTPLQLLGEKEWNAFVRARRWAPVIAVTLLLSLLATLVCAEAGWKWLARSAAALSIGLVVIAVRWLRSWLSKRGIFDPGRLQVELNRILRERVKLAYAEAGRNPDEVPDKITFRDIQPERTASFCRLKIVATDVSGQQLRIFDHRTPDVVVAEAVAASIAIPGVFKPATIPSFEDPDAAPGVPSFYADGGLVSNLPVWSFAEEKLAAERRMKNNAAIPVVAFTLEDLTPEPMPQDGVRHALRYFTRVIRTGIFGGQSVVQEFVPDLEVIRLRTALDVLRFDATWDEAKEAYTAGRNQALARLRWSLDIKPRQSRELLKSAYDSVKKQLADYYGGLGKPQAIHLRACVFEPIKALRQSSTTFVTAYRATHAFNMEEDADDRITLDAECPGVPEAFEQRSVTFLGPSHGAARKVVMTKYEVALIRRTMNSGLCVPIFEDEEQWSVQEGERNQPVAVVSFDSDNDLSAFFTDSKLRTELLESVIEATLGLSSLVSKPEWTQ